MSADEPTDPSLASADGEADEDAPQGVFGNLPQIRPGARSPRRETGAKRETKGASKGTPSRKARPRPATDSAPDRAQAPDHAAESDAGGGLEDVAWAGVAAAAEAATIGVRLATRALEAMRDAVDRR